MKPIGIRPKLTILYTTIFATLLSGFFVAAYYLLSSQLETGVTDELVERATGLRGYLRFENGLPVFAYDTSDPEVAFFVRNATRYYQIYDLTTGTLVTQSPELQLLGLGFSAAQLTPLIPTQGPTLIDVDTDQGKLRFFNDRVNSDSGTPYLLQIGTSLANEQLAVQRFVRLALWLVPFGIVCAATAGWIMAGRALTPVRTLVRAAREIEVNQLSRRLPIQGTGDELDEMARTFNDTFARLAAAIGQMKQFTASIAHELRTPLAILRGESEVALMQNQSAEDYKRVLSSQLEEFEKLDRMINQLLTLARAEAGELKIEHQPVDVTAMLKDLIETFSMIAAAKGISLGLESMPGLVVSGDREWLERALVNLIDNAIKFTKTGGRVDISGARLPGAVAIRIQDTGRGISQDALPHIFERFYREDPSRAKDVEGVGLGLSLVQWIIDQHHGTIEASSQPGVGACFTMRLPDIKEI